MPKKLLPDDVLGRLVWVGKLPETEWSRGVMSTSQSLKDEIEQLEAKKEEIDSEIKKRSRVLRMLPSRAEREALLIYPSEVISVSQEAASNPPAESADSSLSD